MAVDASPARKTFTLAVFFCVNLLNYSDRQCVSGVLPQLLAAKTVDLSGGVITNAEGGMLTTSFIIVYMCVSPIFGYLADRVENRKALVIFGLALWALASGISSFAPSYTYLLAARAAVGIGEASYATVAPVIIADMYPPAERTAKLAVFYIAIPLGSALGFMIGGQVGDMLGWRWALRVTPALLVLLTVLGVPFVHEPARGASDGAAGAASGDEGGAGLGGWLRDVRAVLATPSVLLSVFGAAASNFAIGAITVWVPTFVNAVEGGQAAVEAAGGISPTLVFGGVTVVSGLSGTVLGSVISDKLSATLTDWGAESLVCAIAMLGSAPLIGTALFLATGFDSLLPFWAFVLVGEVIMCFYWAPIAAFMMLVVTPRRRATAQGLSLLASHLFGDAASPVIVGQVVDMILAGHNCCEGCEKCPCVPTSNGSGSWDDSCALPNCAWANATVGMASGCTNSNGAEVSAYQVGLFLTIPAMLISGLLFLWSSRHQPADHRAMVDAMSGDGDGLHDPMLGGSQTAFPSINDSAKLATTAPATERER